MEYRDFLRHPNPKIWEVWQQAAVAKLGCLGDGVNITSEKGTKMVYFIPYGKFPANKKLTYAQFVFNFRPQKEDPHRVWFTVSGDRIN